MQFDTFRDLSAPDGYRELEQDDSSCFNGMVRVRKYRVTIELIEEPVEIIKERIQKLWDENDNHYNDTSLIKEGAKYGLELKR